MIQLSILTEMHFAKISPICHYIQSKMFYYTNNISTKKTILLYKKITNVTVLSDHQPCYGENNCFNKPDNFQIDKLSNVIDSPIKNAQKSKNKIDRKSVV